MMTIHYQVPNSGPDEETLAAIASSLASGALFVLPTDTIYGYHARLDATEALERIVALKGRAEDKPFLLLAASLGDLEKVLPLELDSHTRAFLEHTWPASLTAVITLSDAVPASRGRRSIGVRVPPLTWLRELVRRTGPLASTSVNRSGEAAILRLSEASPELLNNVDGVVDAGPLEGEPSTIVDFTVTPPTVIRSGSFSFTQDLWKTLRKTV
jgi:L-threonylcarbamoyladenylate synthase